MRERNYNIHNLVKFKIRGKLGLPSRLLTNFRLQYKSFESPEIDKPDFTILLGDFSPSNNDCYILDDRFYIKENYLFCEDSYKIARWKLEISGFEEGDTIVRIDANLFAWELIPGFVIDPLIILKLNEKGYSVVHGSCISKDGKAYLFTSQGGGGKTSTTLYAVERGLKFLGDNFIILDEGYVLNLLYPLNLFRFNLTPLVRRNMGIKSKVKLYFIDLMEKVTGFGMATKVNPEEIFPDALSDRGKLTAIFLLLPREGFRITEITREEMLHHLVMNLKLDLVPLIKYMIEYSYMFPRSRVANFWKHYEENLRKNLNGDVLTYKLEIPQKYNLEVFEKIFELIELIRMKGG